MKIEEFETLIWDFIRDNVRGQCKACDELGLELEEDDYKGSYKKALEELFEKIKGGK